MSLKNRRYKGGGIDEDIEEIYDFLRNFNEKFIKELIIKILFVYNPQKEILEVEKYIQNYLEYDFKYLLKKFPLYYKDTLELDYYGNETHSVSFKKYLYTDILISLKNSYKSIRNNFIRFTTYKLNEEQIKEQIKEQIEEQIKRFVPIEKSYAVVGGSFKRQIIKKVIRKY